jgi:hypothetical protein
VVVVVVVVGDKKRCVRRNGGATLPSARGGREVVGEEAVRKEGGGKARGTRGERLHSLFRSEYVISVTLFTRDGSVRHSAALPRLNSPSSSFIFTYTFYRQSSPYLS